LNWKKTIRSVILETEAFTYVHSGGGIIPRVDCSLGSCPFGSPQKVLEKWKTGFSSSPCDYLGDLSPAEEAIVKFWKGVVKREDLILGTGSIGILYNLAAFLGSADFHVLGLAPQFPDAPLYFKYMGSNLKNVFLTPPNYRFEVEDLLSMITENISMVYVDNPHNPTGQVIPLSGIRRVADLCEEKGILLIVDEAYGGFMDEEESSVNLDSENVVSLRSFSKSWGMASLRGGYAVVRDPVLRDLYNKVCPPFPMSPDLVELIPLALGEKDYLPSLRSRVESLKKETLEIINSAPGFSVAETTMSVPIMMVTCEDPEVNLFDLLLQAGIKSEPGEGFESLGKNSIRLRIPSPEKLEEFRVCWKELTTRN